MQFRIIDSPIGPLLLAGDGDVLKLVGLPEGKGRVAPQPGWVRDDTCLAAAASQLREYFAGTRRQFQLRLQPSGTEFQLAVLAALREIPYGETRSYGAIAERIGRPQAVRAVGSANGRNPLPIVIPCHRVIGSDGSLTGFGGGMAAKQFLLALERGQQP